VEGEKLTRLIDRYSERRRRWWNVGGWVDMVVNVVLDLLDALW
jgi:hypothetical protein